MEITQHHKDMVRRKQKTFEKKICFATAIPLLQSIDNKISLSILYEIPSLIINSCNAQLSVLYTKGQACTCIIAV